MSKNLPVQQGFDWYDQSERR